MRLIRVISALAGVAAAVAVPAVATAQPDYPPPPPVLTLSATTITAGDTVTLSGRGYAAGERISVTSVHQALAAGRRGGTGNRGNAGNTGPAMVTVGYRMPLAGGEPKPLTPPFEITADATGAFSVLERFKDPGTETQTVRGETSGLAASITLTVLPHHNLPITGTDLTGISLAGGGLLVVGAALCLATVARRRRGRAGGPGARPPAPTHTA